MLRGISSISITGWANKMTRVMPKKAAALARKMLRMKGVASSMEEVSLENLGGEMRAREAHLSTRYHTPILPTVQVYMHTSSKRQQRTVGYQQLAPTTTIASKLAN